MSLRYWFLFFLAWLAVGLVSLYLGEYLYDAEPYLLSYLLALLGVVTLGSWVFVGIPVTIYLVVGYLHVSAQARKTPKSFLKECPKCGKGVPVASEECPFCKTKLTGVHAPKRVI